jgi:aspartyl-tRNA(Asn)/glutamyl-tRNA(Gln) amidotransferase subunit C
LLQNLLTSAKTTMALQSSDIDRIANLARLELRGNEPERMLNALNAFFDIVEQMKAVDTSGIEPLAHPVAAIQDIQLRLRPDVASEPNNRQANQQSAPAVERGLFLVPKVIE